MKKFVTLALSLTMAMSLVACGGNDKNSETQAQTGAVESTANTDAALATDAAQSTADAQTTDGGKLVMVTEAGFAPYEYTEDGSTVVGVDVDIANEIAKALGKELEIQNMSFDGALLAVQQGKADFAAAGISINEDRQKVMDFSIEYATSRQVVVVNKEKMAVASVDAITPDTKIGVQAGNVADGYCDDQGWQKTQYNKFMEAAMDLKNNKIDCIIMDSLPAEQLVAENDDLVILDGELFTDKYAIAVQKGNTQLLDQINAVLQKLVDEGKVEEYTINHTTK